MPIEQGIMLHDHEAMMILFEDSHELEAGEGSTDLELGKVMIQVAEYARVVATDVERLVKL